MVAMLNDLTLSNHHIHILHNTNSNCYQHIYICTFIT
jgi:hypothetical protein